MYNFSVFRAIFLWLCSKDLTKMNFSNVERGSPEEILMNLKNGQTTYAVVFETLCRFEHMRIIVQILCLVFKLYKVDQCNGDYF